MEALLYFFLLSFFTQTSEAWVGPFSKEDPMREVGLWDDEDSPRNISASCGKLLKKMNFFPKNIQTK